MDEDDVVPFEDAWKGLLQGVGWEPEYLWPICIEDLLFLSDEDRQEHMRWPEHALYGRWGHGEL